MHSVKLLIVSNYCNEDNHAILTLFIKKMQLS